MSFINAPLFSGLGGLASTLQSQQFINQHQFMQQMQGVYQQTQLPHATWIAETKPEEKKKVKLLRDYLTSHRDLIFTVCAALLIDHFILGGALRSRIQKVVEAALTKIEKALGVPDEK